MMDVERRDGSLETRGPSPFRDLLAEADGLLEQEDVERVTIRKVRKPGAMAKGKAPPVEK